MLSVTIRKQASPVALSPVTTATKDQETGLS